MYSYFILIIVSILFIAYYLNFNPFIRKLEEEVDVSDIEITINELKNLNQYIDNGATNHSTVR